MFLLNIRTNLYFCPNLKDKYFLSFAQLNWANQIEGHMLKQLNSICPQSNSKNLYSALSLESFSPTLCRLNTHSRAVSGDKRSLLPSPTSVFFSPLIQIRLASHHQKNLHYCSLWDLIFGNIQDYSIFGFQGPYVQHLCNLRCEMKLLLKIKEQRTRPMNYILFSC